MTHIVFDNSRAPRDKINYKAEFQAQMAQAGLVPKTEYAFAKARGRKWSFDWAFTDIKLAVEYEGGVWGVGKACPVCKQKRTSGHFGGERIKRDNEKYSEATILGWRILKVYVHDIHDGRQFVTVGLDRVRRAVMMLRHAEVKGE